MPRVSARGFSYTCFTCFGDTSPESEVKIVDKIQAAKAAAACAGSAKTAASTEHERQMADGLWYLALAIAEDFNDKRNPRS